MTITTSKRLIIKKATLVDSAFFFKLLNSPNWNEFIGDQGIKTEKDADDYIQNSLINSYEKNGYGLFKTSLKENNFPIGI